MLSAECRSDGNLRQILLCSENLRQNDRKSLEKYFDILTLPAFSRLAPPVASHADMLIFRLPDNELLMHSEYFKKHGNIFTDLGVNIVLTSEETNADYPNDILLNGLSLSGVLYGRTDKLSEKILSGYSKTVFVSQGYTGCSVCKISENAIISADRGICLAASKNGIDTLEISPGHIKIDSYGYGFIGGASLTHGDSILFFGKIEEHPDYNRMKVFAKKHGKHLISLSDDELYDIGSGVIL